MKNPDFWPPGPPAGPPRGSRAGPRGPPDPPPRGVPGGVPDPPKKGHFWPKNAIFGVYRGSPTVSGLSHFERSGHSFGPGEVLHTGGAWTRYACRPTDGSRKVLPSACVGSEDIRGLEDVRLEGAATLRGPRSGPQRGSEHRQTCRLIRQGDRVGRQRTPACWWSSSPATEFAGTS